MEDAEALAVTLSERPPGEHAVALAGVALAADDLASGDERREFIEMAEAEDRALTGDVRRDAADGDLRNAVRISTV
jgi:hypothetical protein